MSNEAFKHKAMIEDSYTEALKSGVTSFKQADADLLSVTQGWDFTSSTVKERRRLWKGCKKRLKDKQKEDNRPLAGGELLSPDDTRERLTGKRFIVTSAQNNTYLHDDFWDALHVYAAKHDAQILVSRFTYNKNGWRSNGGTEGVNAEEDTDGIWFDPRIKPYVMDRQVKLADDLVFCGELDILPTAAQPLSGLNNYTGPNSGIVPHAKVHMQSQATMLKRPAKFMYTTGTVTMRNYLDRKAGQIATFHHTFAALVVEIDDDGDWFVRQLIADDNGVFYDLNTAYGPSWTAPATDFGDTIVTLGDIHIEKVDPIAVSGAINMAKFVKAKHCTVHDLIDFTSRNHHNIRDPHFLVEQNYVGVKSVEAGMTMGARFLIGLQDALPDTSIHVIRSNHDQAFERWLKDIHGFSDPINAPYWCLANAELMNSKRVGNDLDVFVWAMRYAAITNNLPLEKTTTNFLQEDDSLIINGIEHGMHGHRGPNGARGNPKSFRQMGDKVNTAHTHTAGIIDGVWTAGTLSQLLLGYNAGPSSWSHSSILTYPSGKRSIITQRGPKWKV